MTRLDKSKSSTTTLQASLVTLKSMLVNAAVKWCIFAGGAAHAYGSPRPITDIDVLVKKSDLPKVEALGLHTDGKHASFDSIDVVFELPIPVRGRLISFLMDNEMEKRLKVGKVLGVTVPLVPIEDNIILKAMLQRGPKEGKSDIQDIRYMARNPIDPEYLRLKIRFYGIEESVLPVLSELGIL